MFRVALGGDTWTGESRLQKKQMAVVIKFQAAPYSKAATALGHSQAVPVPVVGQELVTCWDIGDDRANPGGHLGQMTVAGGTSWTWEPSSLRPAPPACLRLSPWGTDFEPEVCTQGGKWGVFSGATPGREAGSWTGQQRVSAHPPGELGAGWALQRCPQSRERWCLPAVGCQLHPRDRAPSLDEAALRGPGQLSGRSPDPQPWSWGADLRLQHLRQLCELSALPNLSELPLSKAERLGCPEGWGTASKAAGPGPSLSAMPARLFSRKDAGMCCVIT